MEIQKWREILIPYHQVVRELEVKLNSVISENHKLGKHSPIEMVSGRVKKISSILDKAKHKKIPLDKIEEQIEDIAGIRIICQFVGDIESVVEIIRNRHDMEILSEDDYIREAKESGYRSYHLIIGYNVYTSVGNKRVKAEIQIRTLAMNFWATIEHSLNYKYNGNIPQEVRDRLVQAAHAAYQLDNEMSSIRDEVLVAQDSFQYKSGIIADILNNIQNLNRIKPHSEEVQDIQEVFYKLWEEGNISKLMRFNNHLDHLTEQYKAQSLEN